MKTIILITPASHDYELIDSGNGRKLERYGKIVMSRPDPQALWMPFLSEEKWKKADALFIRKGKSTEWKLGVDVPKEWTIELEGLKFWVKPTAFKHTGVFPEHSPNWKWIKEIVEKSRIEKPRILNLFGYTGGATMAGLGAGAEVTHVDGSKASVQWAKDNCSLNNLGVSTQGVDKRGEVRFMVDDARKFVARELRRGNTYHGIIMDPPVFGYGPKEEPWKIEEHLANLIADCEKLLDPDATFFLLNGYASGYSALSYANNLSVITQKRGGEIECGELALEASSDKRLLSAGIFARWIK